MKKIMPYTLLLGALLFCFLFGGCTTTSPYQAQADALSQAYENGHLTYNEYVARYNELQQLDFQRRQAIAQSWRNAAQSFQNSQPRRGYGSSYNIGNYRYYNWTEY